MTRYDVFNGDADGLCALHQLRLEHPVDARLVTGTKRQNALLAGVPAQAGDEVTVLDLALPGNREALAIEPQMDSQGASLRLLPDANWSRRVSGALANHLANSEPRRAHAVAVPWGEDGLLLSLRVPEHSPVTAHALCARFGGGGRARAAGVSSLEPRRLREFADALARTFTVPGDA